MTQLADFLAKCAPGQKVWVPDLAKRQGQGAYSTVLNTPDVYLDCEAEQCNGYRNFEAVNESSCYLKHDQPACAFLHYRCRNCGLTVKTFALFVGAIPQGSLGGEVVKFGEIPPFGPRTPARVVTLIGPDRDLFLKGRRAETQGLGIGAYAYYRRIVENQKNRLLDEIIKVGKKTNAAPELLQELEAAKKETQFSRAIECIKHGLPPTLLINGHNPLVLLHSALSEGIHVKPDEQCLELATSIREVLFALAEKLGEALKSQAGLDAAVVRLTQSRQEAGAKPDKTA